MICFAPDKNNFQDFQNQECIGIFCLREREREKREERGERREERREKREERKEKRDER
jgi:hypothetical protein